MRRSPRPQHLVVSRRARAHRACGLLALAALAALGAPAAAQQVRVAATPAAAEGGSGQGAAIVTLTWEADVRVTLERSATPAGDELLLRTDAPLTPGAWDEAAPQLTPWLEGVQQGHDALLLRLRPRCRAEVTVAPRLVRLRLWAEAPAAAAAPGDATAQLRLALIQAAVAEARGDDVQAWYLTRALVARAPEEPEAWSLHARAAQRVGHWRRASQALRAAATLRGHPAAPGDRPPVGDAAAPQVEAVALADAQVDVLGRRGLRIAGHGFVAEGLRMALRYELADVGAASDAALAAAVGGDAAAAHALGVGLRLDAAAGHWAGVQAVAAGAVAAAPGVTFDAAWWQPEADTTISAAWGQPRWDLPVFAAFATVRDALRLARAWRRLGVWPRAWPGQLRAHAAVAWERTRATRHGDERVELAGVEAGAGWSGAPGTWRPALTWQAQASWRRGRQGTDAAGGQAMSALLQGNHVHVVTASLRWQPSDSVACDASVGYGLSTRFADAWQGGLGVQWGAARGPFVKFRADRGIATGGAVGAVQMFQLGAGWHF